MAMERRQYKELMGSPELQLGVGLHPGVCVLMSDHRIHSVIQSCPTLCDPMDCSTPGFPVHHQIPELTQIYVHRVGDAIQPSHPLSFQTSQFVTSGGQNIGASAAASVLPMNIQE